MPENILEPQEGWDDAELEIDFWIEEKARKEWLKWRQLNSY